MNSNLKFAGLLLLVLAMLFGAIFQLNDALIQADMTRFFLWTRITVSIAAFPTVLGIFLLATGSPNQTSDRLH